MTGKRLKQPSHWHQWKESNGLSAELALLPYPTYSLTENFVFFQYNNLIHVFTLSSVRYSNNFFYL